MSKLTGLEQDVLDLEAKYDAMDISPEHRCRLGVDQLINDCVNRSISSPGLSANHLREALSAARNEVRRLRLINDTNRRGSK